MSAALLGWRPSYAWLVFAGALAVGLATYWPLANALNGPHDVDEGVYYEAARAWLSGHAPYVDFVYTQPPLSLILLMPAVLGDFLTGQQGFGFVFGRVLSTVNVAATAALVYVLFERRYKAPLAGALAALLLLLDGTVSVVGHRILLEPFLNLATILVLILSVDGRLLWAGLIAALACLTKSQGVLACVPLVVVGCVHRDWPGLAKSALIGGGLVAGVLGLGTWLSSGELIQQAVLFQFVRPTEDTLSDAGGLLGYLLDPRATLLTGAGLLGLFRVGKAASIDRAVTLAVVYWLAAALLLMARSYSYYYHYWLQVALPLALAGGFLMVGAVSGGVRVARLAGVSVLGLVLLRQQGDFLNYLSRDREVALIQAEATHATSVGFDPTTWANIVLNRPLPIAEGKLVIDGFATMQYLELRPFSIGRRWAPYDWDSLTSDLMAEASWVWTDPKGERLLLPQHKALRDELFSGSRVEGVYRFYGAPLLSAAAVDTSRWATVAP